MVVSYEVVDVSQGIRRLTGGQRQLAYTITIVTARGSRGSVRIRAQQYNKEAVRVELQKLADSLELPYQLP